VSSMPLDPRRRPFGGEFTRRVDTGSRAEANTSCHHNLPIKDVCLCGSYTAADAISASASLSLAFAYGGSECSEGLCEAPCATSTKPCGLPTASTAPAPLAVNDEVFPAEFFHDSLLDCPRRPLLPADVESLLQR